MLEDVYNSARLAAGYAFDRPPVHQHIIAAIRTHLHAPIGRALDVGCGAGLSTAVLEPLARLVVGVEPARVMLTHHGRVAPRAQFVAGRAEHLPFSTGTFDLLTAAGSINYTDAASFLGEAARVLGSGGRLVIYDFSEGRRFRDSTALSEWYAAFERRYPEVPGYAMDARRLPFGDHGFGLETYEELEVAVPMSSESYLRYAMSGTRVEARIAAGADETAIRGWCASTLEGVFEHRSRDVLFDGYALVATK